MHFCTLMVVYNYIVKREYSSDACANCMCELFDVNHVRQQSDVKLCIVKVFVQQNNIYI